MKKSLLWMLMSLTTLSGYAYESANDPVDLPATMKVMTLNVGHARADGRTQLLQSSDQARQHLWRIANVLKRENPHVVAFQEIDTDSFWNGRFNHTEFVADRADYPHHFSGAHMQMGNLEYGTALVARQSLIESRSFRFDKPFARPRKGFVVSTMQWPGAEDVLVDVVSVHFDFLTRNQRKKEAHKLIEALSYRDNPRIIMGDLNTDYRPGRTVIPLLEDALNLTTWQPEEQSITFPRFQRRLDWVLVSEQIEIVSHEVLPDPLSDHRAVVAELRLIES